MVKIDKEQKQNEIALIESSLIVSAFISFIQ